MPKSPAGCANWPAEREAAACAAGARPPIFEQVALSDRARPAHAVARRGARWRNAAAWLLFLPLVSAGIPALAQTASGQQSGTTGDLALGLQAVIGFSDTFRIEHWVPVTVMVDNRGPDLVGHVEVVVPAAEDSEASVVHRQRLELPRDARKRLRFTVFVARARRPLLVRLVGGGRELARLALDLEARFTEDRLLLVLSRDADLDYLNDTAREGLRVLYPHPELLPDRWQGYDGVEALVIHGVSLEALTPSQFRALQKWLAQGGIVAVSGGPDQALLRTPRLAGLLPGTPRGTVRFEDGSRLAEAFAMPLDAPLPLAVNRLADGFRGRVRYAAGEIPLVVEESRGRGRVLYLAFDIARYPFARWEGMRRLWHDSLRLPPVQPISVRPPPAAPSGADPVREILREQAAGFPGHGTLLFFVALYLGVLATLYRLQVLRRGVARLFRWAGFAVPPAFALVAWYVFGPLLFPPGASGVAVSLIEPYAGSPYAHLKVDVGLFTNRDRPLRFDYRGLQPAFRPAVPGAHWVLGPTWAEPRDQRRYVLHELRGEDILAYRVEGSVTRAAEGSSLALRNDSGTALRDAVLIVDGRAHALGTIPDGGEFARALGRGWAALEVQYLSWRDVVAGAAGWSDAQRYAAQVVLERELGELSAGDYARPGEALLLALTANPLRAVTADAWRQHALALVVARLAVTGVGRGNGP